MMHRTSKIGVVLGVALLVAGLAAPAGAKKGGHPGPPSGTGLEVTVETSGYMTANSIGDQILFDVTVTNNSGGKLSGVTVKFIISPDFDGGGGTFDKGATFDLADGVSWTAVLTYLVGDGDFTELPYSTQTDVKVGTVTASGGGVSDSDDAIMKAYPVDPCPVDTNGTITFGPNDDYLECSFKAASDSTWTLTTTLPKPVRGKNFQGATVRDGVPGNWCMYGDGVVSGNTVTQQVFLPADGICLQGGAGGDPIPVRNANTFYLATWTGNEVTLTPPTAQMP